MARDTLIDELLQVAQAEKARRRAETRNALAQQLCSTGSFSWRPSTNEIMWSEEVYRIFALEAALPPSVRAHGFAGYMRAISLAFMG